MAVPGMPHAAQLAQLTPGSHMGSRPSTGPATGYPYSQALQGAEGQAEPQRGLAKTKSSGSFTADSFMAMAHCMAHNRAPGHAVGLPLAPLSGTGAVSPHSAAVAAAAATAAAAAASAVPGRMYPGKARAATPASDALGGADVGSAAGRHGLNTSPQHLRSQQGVHKGARAPAAYMPEVHPPWQYQQPPLALGVPACVSSVVAAQAVPAPADVPLGHPEPSAVLQALARVHGSAGNHLVHAAPVGMAHGLHNQAQLQQGHQAAGDEPAKHWAHASTLPLNPLWLWGLQPMEEQAVRMSASPNKRVSTAGGTSRKGETWPPLHAERTVVF